MRLVTVVKSLFPPLAMGITLLAVGCEAAPDQLAPAPAVCDARVALSIFVGLAPAEHTAASRAASLEKIVAQFGALAQEGNPTTHLAVLSAGGQARNQAIRRYDLPCIPAKPQEPDYDKMLALDEPPAKAAYAELLKGWETKKTDNLSILNDMAARLKAPPPTGSTDLWGMLEAGERELSITPKAKRLLILAAEEEGKSDFVEGAVNLASIDVVLHGLYWPNAQVQEQRKKDLTHWIVNVAKAHSLCLYQHTELFPALFTPRFTFTGTGNGCTQIGG